jgi:hypothetical protein
MKTWNRIPSIKILKSETMKKIISKIIFVLAAVTLLISCEADYVMFDSSKNFVAFPSKTTAVAENGGQVAIPVYVVALKGSPAVSVTFDFEGEGAGAAIEGEDFTLVNDSKTLDFPDGFGYDTIWIMPIDNDEFTGNKIAQVVLQSNSADYAFGAISSNALTVVDDEHPLKNWIGSYSVVALSYGNPGGWDEAWTVTTSTVEGELAQLSLVINTGNGGGEPFLAEFDQEEMTISIPGGTDAGNIYGYGPTAMYAGDYWNYLDKESAIVGTIADDGTILIDEITMILSNYGDVDGLWDAFNTTWTKTGKKSSLEAKDLSSKADRFK